METLGRGSCRPMGNLLRRNYLCRWENELVKMAPTTNDLLNLRIVYGAIYVEYEYSSNMIILYACMPWTCFIKHSCIYVYSYIHGPIIFYYLLLVHAYDVIDIKSDEYIHVCSTCDIVVDIKDTDQWVRGFGMKPSPGSTGQMIDNVKTADNDRFRYCGASKSGM